MLVARLMYRKIVVTLLSLCFISSCSHAGDTESRNKEPVFSGPYARELTEAYRESDSEFFKKAIVDGSVTRAEYLEAQEREAKCLRDRGFTGVKFNSDGTSSMDVRSDLSDEAQLAIADECAKMAGSDSISSWYNALNSNPDNFDWPSAERDCLVRAGLLEPGTTVEQMNQWYDDGGEGSDSRQAIVCRQDALGKLGLK